MKIQNAEMEFVAFASCDVIATSGVYIHMGKWFAGYPEETPGLEYENCVWTYGGTTYVVKGATGCTYDTVGKINGVTGVFDLSDAAGVFYQLKQGSKMLVDTVTTPGTEVSYLIGVTEGNVGKNATGDLATVYAWLGLQ